MKNLVGELTNPIYVIKVGATQLIILDKHEVTPQKDERLDQVKNIKKYFKDATKTHGGYAIKYFLCEILALVNIIGQMYLTDR